MAGFEKLSVPVGPSSCARAATSKEAAFRIDHPLPPARNTRVVALDEPAAGIVRDAAALEWGQARFFTVKDPGPTLVEVGAVTSPSPESSRTPTRWSWSR